MKFFVDTAEIDQIKELNDLGMVDGVTRTHHLLRNQEEISLKLQRKFVRL